MPSQAIGVDIGSHAVKIAVLQKKGGITRSVRLFRAPLAGDTDPVRIQGALARAGVSGGPALVGITGRDLIIRYTHVPPVPDWRLQLLMQFEINEVSGQSGEEVAADYKRLDLPVDGGNETVLVALARNSWLGPRLDASRGAGIRAAGGCPNSVAIFNAFLAHGSWKDGETVFLVNLGRDNIDMSILRDGELLFARNMAGGGQMFTEAIMQTFALKESKAEKSKITKGDLTPRGAARYPDPTTEKLANAMSAPAGQLVSMIQSSVMICRAQTKIADLNVDRLVLSGGGAQLKGIAEYFSANMSVPVDLFDPVSELDRSALPTEDEQELGTAPLDFAVAIGLAETLLHPGAFDLEVLSERGRKKRKFVERTVWSLGAAALTLVLIVLLFQARAQGIDEAHAANSRLSLLARQTSEVEQRGEAAQKTEKDARQKAVVLRSRLIAGQFARSILDVLYRHHAAGMYLRSVQVSTEKGDMDLTGAHLESNAYATTAEESKVERIKAQQVWPTLDVVGQLQPEYSTNYAEALNKYYTSVEAAVRPLKILDHWKINMKTTAVDRQKRFTMRFTLIPLEPAKSTKE